MIIKKPRGRKSKTNSKRGGGGQHKANWRQIDDCHQSKIEHPSEDS